jgi:hypothetical protein
VSVANGGGAAGGLERGNPDHGSPDHGSAERGSPDRGRPEHKEPEPGSPEDGWGGRSYRTGGTFERREANGVWGVGIPLKTPSLALELLLAAFAVSLIVMEGFGIRRLILGEGGWRPLVGIVLLVPFIAIFGLGAAGAHRLRSRPTRYVVVTAEGVSAPLMTYRWDEIKTVEARSYSRRGHIRNANIIVLTLTEQAETQLQRAGRVGRWIDRATGHAVRLLDAATLDTDPWRTIQGLRAVAADPALRARLAGPDGPRLFLDQPGRPR